MTAESFQEKLWRHRQCAEPRILDLFTGCGGLSVGFRAAAFEIAAAVENDPAAAASYGLNYHPADPGHAAARDIASTPPCPKETGFGLRAHDQGMAGF